MRKILLAGDSTVADYPQQQRPMTGWGQALGESLKERGIEVKNFAKPGATTKSFMEEGLWGRLKAEITANDIVMIQFGHNDQKPENGVLPEEYAARLTEMLTTVKEKGAQGILCTPTERRLTDDGINIKHTFSQQLPILRRLAEKMAVPLYDLNGYTCHTYQATGLENAKKFFVWSGVGELANYPEGSQDNTHFNETGAAMIARYVAIRLEEFLRTEPIFKKHYYGACMYPEVWDQEIFEADVAHMASIGMNFARFGEFAWKTVEPQPGSFDLSLFESALKTYQKHEVDVCLCIPTPTPPRWFTKLHPEARIKNIDGTVMAHGSRQQCCTNNEDYRRYAYRMTRKVAALAEKYDNVIAIQLDNEFKCHVDLCYCDTCRSRWHQYLHDEYGTVQWLNKGWGTAIWSEGYDHFEEVVLPTKTPFLHNSSLMNAFRKFTADTLNEFAHDLCHFVRMETAVPITHNTAFGFNLMNDSLFKDLDVAGFDTYPKYTNYPWYTMNLDRWRNVRETSNEVLLLETCTSHNGHIENYEEPAPEGWIPAEVFTGFAGNLKSFTYWHYRSHRFGVEQPHSAVVTAWGEPDEGYQDVVKAGTLVQEMSPYLAATEYVAAKVGFIYSDHSKRAYLIDSGGVYDHRGLVTDYYGSLIRQGINVEMIHEASDYQRFDLLVVPYVRTVTSEMLAKFQDFTEKGGKIIFGPMTGDRTEELAWPAENGLDRLGKWLGLSKITQYTVKNLQHKLTYQEHETELSGLVTAFSGDDSWQVLAQGPRQETFIAKKQLGAGSAIYVGGQPRSLQSDALWAAFVKNEMADFDQDRTFVTTSNGIMKYRRENQQEIQLYICNMEIQTGSYQLHQAAEELLSEKTLAAGEITLAPYAYQILRFEK